MLNLIKNENMKIYRRPRTWVMLALVLVIVIGLAVLFTTVIDEEVAENMLQFMNITKNLTIIVFILAVVVTADIVAGEFTWGTIKLLLIRPATRSKILFSKYIASTLFLLLLLVLLYVSSAIVGLLFFGNAGTGEELSFLSILKSYGFITLDLFVNLSIAFMISSVFRSSTLAIALSFIFTFVSGTVMGILISLKYTWAKYILFANTNLEVYTPGNMPPLEGMTLGFSITMLILYYIILMGMSFLVFRKRDVAG
jgi:ABC-2 type transport system permease protein